MRYRKLFDFTPPIDDYQLVLETEPIINAIEISDFNGDGLYDVLLPFRSRVQQFGQGEFSIVFDYVLFIKENSISNNYNSLGSIMQYKTSVGTAMLPARGDKLARLDYNGDGIQDLLFNQEGAVIANPLGDTMV